MEHSGPIYKAMLFTAAGAALAVFALDYFILGKKRELKPFFAFAGALGSAFLLNWIFNCLTRPDLSGEPFYKSPVNASFNYYYTLVFFVLAAAALLKLLKLDAGTYMNIAAPSLIVFGAIGKIGCTVAGCCGGIAVGSGHIPVAEIECAWLFVSFAVFQFLFKENRARDFLLTYSVFRLLTEFLRADSGTLRLFGVITPAQWIAAAVIIVMIVNFNEALHKSD